MTTMPARLLGSIGPLTLLAGCPDVLFLTTERSPLALTDANCIKRTEINVDHVTRAMVRLKPISQLRTPHDPSCSVQVCPAVDFAFGLQPRFAKDQMNRTFLSPNEAIKVNRNVEESFFVICLLKGQTEYWHDTSHTCRSR